MLFLHKNQLIKQLKIKEYAAAQRRRENRELVQTWVRRIKEYSIMAKAGSNLIERKKMWLHKMM